MTAEIKLEAEDIHDELIEIRRKIHKNPELGFQEFETAKLIKTKLDEIGIPYEGEIAKTGIVATITGNKPGKTILLRADMDALPMQEDVDLEFKSENDEIMHACGHDTHVSSLLGAARILNKNRSKFPGEVKLVFQPAEEGSQEYDPSGKIPGGALPMIIERPDIFGTADNPKMDAVLSLHIVGGDEDDVQVGQIGVADGPFTGSSDEFYITIKGEGGHASAPHSAVDPVYIASQVYTSIQGFISRIIDPMEPVVFTIGKILGGFRQNIISETCKMEGTLRTLNEEVRDKLKEKLPSFIKSVAQSFGGDAEIEIFKGYPVGVNSKLMNDHVRKVTQEMYGQDVIHEVDPQLGAEDFYEFGFKNEIPITMFWLGGSDRDKGWTAGNHSNYFAINEDALPMGSAIFAAATMSFLNDEDL